MPKRLKPAAAEGVDKRGQSTPQGNPLDLTDLGLPAPDQAYRLHLEGYSLREIARKLDIDKSTANRYVRQLERETAPWRKDARGRWRRQAVAKLEHVQSAAWRRWDEVQDPMLLNTISTAEDKIARIRGLYEQEMDEGASGVTITISRRGGVSASFASVASGAGAAEAGDVDGGDADE